MRRLKLIAGTALTQVAGTTLTRVAGTAATQAAGTAPGGDGGTVLVRRAGRALTGVVATALAGSLPVAAARAQIPSFAHAPAGPPGSNNAPVTFHADEVSYDSHDGIVTLSGHVEAWQNDRVVRADRVTYDRNTNVVAATGHVALVEPDGQVVFADYAELTQGMRDGVLTGMRALLASNARLAANGTRRTEGHVSEMSRAVYTTCNPCALDPSKPPLWQIRAFSATQDTENKRIEYRDAVLDFAGLPVAYIPYFSNPTPEAKRQSGFLTPGFGLSDKYLGTFVSLPYYLVIDPQSDVTIIPTVGTKDGPQLEANYRRRFNDGTINLTGAVAYDESKPQGYILGRGSFNYNDTWRYGFNINLASSAIYTRDFRLPGYGSNVYASTVYAEGFGVGSYARVDALAFQALNTTVTQNQLPYVLPRYSYSYFGEPDALGGRLSLDTTEYNVLREQGTTDQKASLSLNWDRPFDGLLGERYVVTLRNDAAAYNYSDLNEQPNYATGANGQSAHSQPQAAVKMNWPFVRDAGGGASQLIEPIVQLIAAPQSGYSRNDRIPNEDALDYEFTDSTLFSLNRYAGQGTDRIDGGERANVALHANWTFGGTQQLDGIVGESFRQHVDQNMLPLTGLEKHASDVVTRATYTPAPWLDFTGRGRFDKDNGNVTFADGLVSAGTKLLRVNGGYIYDDRNPFYLYGTNPYTTTLPSSYFSPINEVTAGASSQFGPWKLSGFARRDIKTSQMVAVGGRGTYEDECFIFDVNLFRRYTSILGDNGDTTILFTLTFKTIGQFGFNAS